MRDKYEDLQPMTTLEKMKEAWLHWEAAGSDSSQVWEQAEFVFDEEIAYVRGVGYDNGYQQGNQNGREKQQFIYRTAHKVYHPRGSLYFDLDNAYVAFCESTGQIIDFFRIDEVGDARSLR